MPKISALVQIANNDRQLGRALESLRPCDEVIVVNHGAGEGILKMAREHGARIIQGVTGVEHGAYAQDARHDWILCLRPDESVAEDLEASLLEWKQSDPAEDHLGYSIPIREQIGRRWRSLAPELRLANRRRINWTDDRPPQALGAHALEGHILRIPQHE
jgi:hypothetical protein